MKKIVPILAAIFIFACSSYPTTSTLSRMGGEDEILRKLSDPELRKDKIFVMANMADIADFVVVNIRVNGEVLQIKNSEILVFDLIEGENSILSFGEIFGDEVRSCRPYENYVFNTADFKDTDTHYFVIVDRGCYADLHLEKEGFFYIKSNPDLKWQDNPWLINKDWATWNKYSNQWVNFSGLKRSNFFWLNAIYGVNLRTNEFDTGFITDLHTIAENIADNHDSNYKQ